MHALPRLTLSLIAAFTLLMAAGCTPLGQLKRATQQDRGDFYSSLAVEYLAFAQSEAELAHEKNRDYFASKGLRANRHAEAEPENPADWDINADTTQELINARNRLMAVRTEFLMRVASQQVARAQLLYDCWVVQTANGTDNDFSLPCRQEFLHEMEGLEEVVATLGPAPTISLPTSITILFPSDSSELTHDGEYAIREIVAITTLSPHYRITVTGHTDRSGRAEYNQALSEARAERVKHALVDAGLDIERITTAAAGEEALATPTLDGILRRQNRRVVVSITSDAMTNEKEEKEE